MSDIHVNNALQQLRKKADFYAENFFTGEWDKVAGPGPSQVTLNRLGSYPDIVLEPGKDLVLETKLTFPEQIGDVVLLGEQLELTIFCLYPIEILVDESTIFAEENPLVATGPGLVTILPEITAGENGTLRLVIHLPDFQMTNWLTLTFTTPGLRKQFELFDVAWAELRYAQILAKTPLELKAVEKAAEIVLDQLDSFSDNTLSSMEEQLAFVREKNCEDFVHLIGHSHIDMNWLWTWPDTKNVILRDFKSVADMMDDYPELTFTHSQPATYAVVQQSDPELFQRVCNRIREGRWEAATMTWVEGDTNMASGEAMAHHLLESSHFTRTELKTNATVFMAPDTFGHAGNLPQMAVSAGAKCYYHHRANPGKANLWPVYWWEGQDNTRLLTISTDTYNGNIRARDLIHAIDRAKRFGHSHALHFHGIGDHGGGPARQNLDALRRLQKHDLLPAAQCSTLESYRQEILKNNVDLPVHRGESSTIFEGCYTTQTSIKTENRKGENLLCSAETLAALAGLEYPGELHDAWQTVLFNQFHDIFDGSSIHEVYAKSTQDFQEVARISKLVTDQALDALVVKGTAEDGLLVVNPLGWERTEWITIPWQSEDASFVLHGSHGHTTKGQCINQVLGFSACLPAYTAVKYSLEKTDTASQNLFVEERYAPNDHHHENWLTENLEEPPYFYIETPFFCVYLRRDSGILTSFYDKQAEKELVAYGMRKSSDYLDSARADLALNVFQIEKEHPHGMSAWQMHEVHSTCSLLRGAHSEIIENGTGRIVIEVKHSFGASRLVERISFYRDLPYVDFEVDIDWNEVGNEQQGVTDLKVAFTGHLINCESWFETPFAAVRRPADGQEVPALRWMDVGGDDYGMALLNDGKYGCDILGTRMRLTLVRSAYDPDRIADIGQHTARFRFVPHLGNWKKANIVRNGIEFNQPSFVKEVSGDDGQIVHNWKPEMNGAENIIPSIYKQSATDDGYILRCYESCGEAASLRLSAIPENTEVWLTNLLEEKITRLDIIEGQINISFRPWEIKTLLFQAG